MITKEIVLYCAREDRLGPTGCAELNALFDSYNEGSPRSDDARYYRFLYNLAQDFHILTFLELGCKYGVASLHVVCGICNNLGGPAESLKIFAIDVVDIVKPTVRVQDQFSFIKANSTDSHIPSLFQNRYFDVALIDTDHTYATTVKEFELWEPKVKPGGIILFDDIDAPEYADGCGKFFRELPGEKLSLPHLHPEDWGFGVWFKPEIKITNGEMLGLMHGFENTR